MTTGEQAWVNFVDSKATSALGIAVLVLQALCAAGLVSQLFSQQVSDLICSMVTPASVAAATTLIVSRGPNTPPR